MQTLTSLIHFQPFSSPHLTQIRNHFLPPKSLNLHPPKTSISIKKHDHRLVPHGMQNPSEHHRGAHEASERLFAAVKNRNLRELSELIGNECQSFRYVPFMQSLIGKKQALAMLASLVAFVVNHIEFVVKPMADGADIGINWRFAWEETNIPLGPVCSLYTSQDYYGKILLRNGKVFIGPLLHIEPLRLKMEEIVMPMLEKILPNSVLRGNRKAAFLNCLLSLLFMAISLKLLKKIFV